MTIPKRMCRSEKTNPPSRCSTQLEPSVISSVNDEIEDFVDHEGSCFSSRRIFSFSSDRSSLLAPAHSSESDLLLDLPSGGSFPEGHHALDVEREAHKPMSLLFVGGVPPCPINAAASDTKSASSHFLGREKYWVEERRKGSTRRCCCRPSASQPLSPDHESERNMASYGGVLRRSAAVIERARDGARRTRKALARFARPQSFAAPHDAEAAAVRAVRNLRSFRLHYAILLWVLLLASLFPRRRATMLFLMAASKIALFCGALLKAFPNSALLGRIVDRRLAAALLLAMIGVELVMTRAVPQFLLAMAIGVPLVLLHAVFRVRDDLTASGQEAAGAGGGALGPISEKKEDLELGSG
ncbi:hypothetical protein BHE74_00007620 [Ensete ventricosum]|nr:hypothetical protein BHE74_00007620 [Ensete ventricosum]